MRELLARGPVRCVWPLAAELGEGAYWSAREQALFFVDILGQRLHRFDPDSGVRRSWDFDEPVSAVAERAGKPGLLVTLRSGFAVFDPADASLTRLHAPAQEPADNRFNDGKCDARGRFWAGTTDMACERPAGSLYRFDADGSCSVHAQGLCIVNGPTWSSDGRTMFVNETGLGRTWAYDFDPQQGSLGPRRLWLQHPGWSGAPDGMTTDRNGRLWIARWGGAAVACHEADGDVRALVRLPTSNVTSCAFGGKDLDTLYITTARTGLNETQRALQPLAGGLFAVDLHVQGEAGIPFAG